VFFQRLIANLDLQSLRGGFGWSVCDRDTNAEPANANSGVDPYLNCHPLISINPTWTKFLIPGEYFIQKNFGPVQDMIPSRPTAC
jgi:hypothetical protein